MKAFNPTDKVTVELDALSWNIIMDQLHDGRYRVVAPIIATLGKQLDDATEQHRGVNIVPMGAAE